MKTAAATSAALRLFYGMQGAVDEEERWELFRDFLREVIAAGDEGPIRALRVMLGRAQQVVDELLSPEASN